MQLTGWQNIFKASGEQPDTAQHIPKTPFPFSFGNNSKASGQNLFEDDFFEEEGYCSGRFGYGLYAGGVRVR